MFEIVLRVYDIMTTQRFTKVILTIGLEHQNM